MQINKMKTLYKNTTLSEQFQTPMNNSSSEDIILPVVNDLSRY